MAAAAELLGYRPKHALVADQVRNRIISGQFRKGDKLLPDDKLAAAYQVNKQTVANALNALVEEGLLERAPRRGTIVIHDARADRPVGRAVGLVMMSEDAVYGDISRGIMQRFSRRGLYPVQIDYRMLELGDRDAVLGFVKSFISDQAKPYGVLFNGLCYYPFEFLQEHADLLDNVVFLIHYAAPDRLPAAKYALVDLIEAGRLAARHFIGRGHKRLCCLALPEGENPRGALESIQVRLLKGFAQECREQNVAFSEASFWNLLLGAPLETTLTTLLKGPERPTAIFSYFDFFLREQVIPLLESNGLKSGQDVELIGFFNTHHAAECGFSSISIHEDQIAEAAVKLLSGETTEQQIMISPELVVRG